MFVLVCKNRVGVSGFGVFWDVGAVIYFFAEESQEDDILLCESFVLYTDWDVGHRCSFKQLIKLQEKRIATSS